ncbi:MAG: phosphoribosyl-ATP diphosphatase [Spirochaetales bacterium]|nr:phosphoribosyl-ATP diphosphatase [Spirochaetales bacterium]
MSSSDPSWPLIVHIGNSCVAALMNRKAYRKSIENGVPWIVHPETGRVLPWPGDPQIQSLAEGPGSFELTVPADTNPLPYGEDLPPQVNPDDRSEMAHSSEQENSASTEDVLSALSSLVAQRHRAMPAGSYTTHLFEKGLEKIRKKVGEEAVELILAQEKDDVIYESADLVYHMLVLLEASNLEWKAVTQELARRHQDG